MCTNWRFLPKLPCVRPAACRAVKSSLQAFVCIRIGRCLTSMAPSMDLIWQAAHLLVFVCFGCCDSLGSYTGTSGGAACRTTPHSCACDSDMTKQPKGNESTVTCTVVAATFCQTGQQQAGAAHTPFATPDCQAYSHVGKLSG